MSGLYGSFYFMQACFPHMRQRGGKIINLGSAAGTDGLAGYAAYGAAKEAIRALTRIAAHE
jgi:NAD(P)-dependent dehydrogenase (short-subunit alcohol dehydrogenase family)